MSRTAIFALPPLLFAVACGETVGVGETQPGDDPGATPTTSAVRVTMQRAVGPGAAPSSALLAAAEDEEDAAQIDLANVLSLTIRVVRLEVLPAANDEEEDGQWISLELEEPVTLDLIALPTEGESPLVIVAGELDVGDYQMLRLFVDEAMITFDQPFTVGLVTYEGEHPVMIPSADQTGIKTDIMVTVSADGDGEPQDVGILFDAEATIQNAVATGAGMVILAPVLRADDLEDENEDEGGEG